jgi:subtilase family serine protease
MRHATKSFMAGTAILSTAGLMMIGFAPNASASQKPVWEAHPPIHVKGNATSTYQAGYQPSQVRTAYGVNQLSYTGAGETIAIVDAYGSPTIQNDLNTFDSQFGLANTTVSVAYPSGKPSRTDGGWALETSLDVEWAHALAPDAKIMLVVAKSASISDLLAAIQYATNNGAQVVSNSWGGSEFSSEASDDTYFEHSGVVYTASAGDSGAQAEWPAASPYILSVGGTSLTINSNGSYGGETVWSSSGGDKSVYEARPAYQNNWTSVVSSQRGIPDIAWGADPNTGVAVYDSTSDQGQKGWFEVGGTSVGAPSWAAMIALADQGRTSPLSNSDVMTQLYNLAGTTGSSGYTTNFHDITSGSNGNSALPGYDLATGLGSLQANNLIPALVSAP